MITHIDGTIEMKMPAEKYLNNPNKVAHMEEMGIDIDPVDLNGNFVPVNKMAKDNLIETQESIRDNFNLGGD